MLRFHCGLLAGILCFLSVPVLADPLADHAGFKDPPLFTRLPNYFLSEGGAFEERQFDGFEFRVKKGNSWEGQRVEGHFTHYGYSFDESKGAPASKVQVMRNYQNAAAKLGGKVLFENDETTTIRLTRNGAEIWVAVEAYYNNYGVTIVERQSMQQDVAADAAAFRKGLAEEGHVTVPGIFFDFGKAEVKPESGPALQEVAKLLKANPSMKVWVVGHTDYAGPAETNAALSNARAAAVIRVLTQQFGIEARRLSPHGNGPFAPVASNKTDEGRAKNRRVELVEQP